MFKMKKNIFENRFVILELGVLALIMGVMLVNPTLTGNIISTKKTSFINPLTIIGLCLNVCAIILFTYLLNKKK